MSRRARARQTFLADQRAAAAADTGRIVRDAARNARRPLSELTVDHPRDLAANLSADPLTHHAVAIFLGMHQVGHVVQCAHLVDGAPAPRWWTSALPTRIWCGRGPCTVLAVGFVMQTQGLLPARCAVCGGVESKPRLEVALDDVRLVLHVCVSCFQRLSPGGDS